jgi:hypothetical protein
MFTKAPTLAWLLTALACFLAGMAVVESRHQTIALPVVPPVGVVVTVEVAFAPTSTPEPAPAPTAAPTVEPWAPLDVTPAPRPGGTGNVR